MIHARPLKIVYSLLLALVLTLAPHLTSAQENTPEAITLASTFTYQGYLEQGGVPLTATCDMQFALFDALTAGTQIGTTLTRTNLAVNGGVFNAPLDFGATAFNGEDRYLAISLRCPAGAGAYTALTPRQPITPVPYAMYANQAPWAGLTGVPAGFADGVDNTGVEGSAWSLTGNVGTNPASNFIGTTDDQPLEFRVNNTRVMRYELNGGSPNVIGGYSGNNVTGIVVPTSVGATIAGGGNEWAPNVVNGTYGTVGGGMGNTAGSVSTVGGGFNNMAGSHNTTIGGGETNAAYAPYGTIGGGFANVLYGSYATIGGGYYNRTDTYADFATIGGGGPTNHSDPTTSNFVTDWYGTIGGGGNNQAGDDDSSGLNRPFATVGGGEGNVASGSHATIGGGRNNVASGSINATVGGGEGNAATATESTIGGGFQNTASEIGATIGGGNNNIASAVESTVGGGQNNTASGFVSIIGGGQHNLASGQGATIAGGESNAAVGAYAAIPGGYQNAVGGDYSFGAGIYASIDATHDYSFVWSGTTDEAGTASFGANTFTARAPGGVRFYSASTGTTNGVELAAGAGAWSSLSDRNAKANFNAVDARAVLDALVNLPVTTWNYLTQDDSIRHIGVMAQDFYAAFGVGEDDTHISTIDADGVLFAAVQGLNAKLEDENAALRAEVETLHGQNAALEARLARLEALADGGQTASLLPVSLLPFGLLLIGGLAGVWVAQRKPSP